MPTVYKKRIRKYRGKRQRGYGTIGAHRAKGQKGGTGLTTGKFKHKWTYYMKQKALGFPDPAWIIGKKGFIRPQNLRRINAVNPINIKDVEIRVDEWVTAEKVEKKGTTYIIDLKSLGFNKLLGSGKITKKMEITVAKATAKAVGKFKEAKCKLTLTAKKPKAKAKGKDQPKGKGKKKK